MWKIVIRVLGPIVVDRAFDLLKSWLERKEKEKESAKKSLQKNKKP